MRLASLEMLGFKSFMNKAELRFQDGITAILGPNGCGKSNIVDALRWVLGEQSARLLRGAKMENVIFDGTRKRPPMGIAEVTLTFTGASQRLPVEWDEIAIKRRTTRSGGSEYFLNNQPYRLHEIKDLLSGAGLSDHSYAIIERDMIEDVLAPGGEKRRHLFEEASGIAQYKMRRKESLSKLASTEADLMRLEDILEELGKNVRSLKYQVSRARSYQRLQEELKDAEIHAAAHELHRFHGEEEALAARLTALEDLSRAAQGKIALVDEEAARLQADLLAAEDLYRQERDVLERERALFLKGEEELALLEEKSRTQARRAADLDAEARQLEGSLEGLLGERQGLGASRAELDETGSVLSAALADLEGRARGLEKHYRERRDLLQREKQLQLDFVRSQAESGGERERLRERLAQSQARGEELRQEARAFQQQSARLQEELAEARQAESEAGRAKEDAVQAQISRTQERKATEQGLADLDARLQALALKREQHAARRELLGSLQEEGAGYPAGSRRLLETKGGDPGLKGALAELIQVDAQHREALESALDEVLGALVLAERHTALAWLKELREQDGGRAILLALDGVSPGGARDRRPSAPELIPLISLVRCEAQLHAVLARILGGCYLAPNAEAALSALAEEGDQDLTLVTSEGLLLTRSALLAGGAAATGDRPLARAAEIERLDVQLQTFAAEIAELESARASAESGLARLDEALRAGEGRIDEARQRHSACEVERARREIRLVRLSEESEALESEQAYQQRQGETLAEALAQAEEAMLHLLPQSEVEIDLAALESEVLALEREREEVRAALGEKRLESETARGRRENLELRLENLARAEEQTRSRRSECELGAAESRRQIAELDAQAQARRESLAHGQAGLEARREEVDRIQAGIAARRAEQQELAARTRSLREEQREEEQSAHALAIERNTLGVKMEDLRRSVAGKHGVDLDPAADPALASSWRPAEGQTHDQALADLADKIQRLGIVNLLALEEYEEKNQRYEFLIAQREDLVKARQGLMETIDRINREARQRFAESFRVIRQNFIEIFLTLFEGGEADLSFSASEEDPLEADIRVTARPREKTISNVQLLSTGEKTLTSLALVFAVYLTKPSPFCVFDEVDAPLDDANIIRFLRLVKEFSDRIQFLLITHNKKTMEVAAHLYGVTMEESGVSKVVSVAFEEVPDDLETGMARTAS